MKIERVISWPNIHIVQMRCIYGSSPSKALILASLTYDHQLEVQVEISCKILNALYINSVSPNSCSHVKLTTTQTKNLRTGAGDDN